MIELLGSSLTAELRRQTQGEGEIEHRDTWLRIAEALLGAATDWSSFPRRADFARELISLWMKEVAVKQPTGSDQEPLRLLRIVCRALNFGALELPRDRPLLDMVAAHLFDAPLTTSTAADLADTIMECLYKDGQGIAQTESILSSIMSGLRAAIESTRRSGLASYEASFVLGIHALYMSEDLRDFFAQKALDSLNTQHPLSMQQILRIMDHCRPSAGLREAYRARLETMLTQAETEPRRIRILETMIAGWSERYTTKENRLTVARYYFEDPSSSDFRHLYAANLADLGEGSPEILTALLSGIDVQQTVVDALGTFGPEQLQALDAVRLALESDYPVSASIALGLAGLRDPRLLETVLTSPRNWRDQDMLPRFLQRWVEDSPSDMARIEAAVDEVRPMAPEELRQAFPDGGDGVI